jgi:hypothetical protein
MYSGLETGRDNGALTVFKGGIFIPIAFFGLNETYAPVLLERKVRKLRKETGNQSLRAGTAKDVKVVDQFKMAIIRPLKLLVVTPIVTLMALYVAITYGILYLLITTFSFVYTQHYGFTEGTSGLTYLPAGLGMMIGVILFGQLSDRLVKGQQAKGLALRPEVRLKPKLTIPSGIVIPVGLFIYGWTTQYHVHWIVPMIGVVIFSSGLMGIMVRPQPPPSLASSPRPAQLMISRCAFKITFSTRTRAMLPP